MSAARGGGSSLTEGKLPLFVFPSSITFYSDDQASHKQVFTLYNPYDFPLRFKVLCTAPRRYTVVDSEGAIRPKCVVDVVVRHQDICINNEGVNDLFRIQVTEQGQRKILGTKDLDAVLLPKKGKEPTPSKSKFHALPNVNQEPEPEVDVPSKQVPKKKSRGGPDLIVILAALACIFALALPLIGEEGSMFPDYLHLSVNQKLVAAYVLGLITMLVLHL